MADNSPILIGRDNVANPGAQTLLRRDENSISTDPVFTVRTPVGGDGIHAEASGTRTGVQGTSDGGSGVDGRSSGGTGVVGRSDTGSGMDGFSTNGFGVSGTSPSGTGVGGFSDSGTGVRGQSDSGTGVIGEGGFRAGSFDGSVDVFGNLAVTGVMSGQSSSFVTAVVRNTGGLAGVWGECDNPIGAGVFGSNNTGTGVFGFVDSGTGVRGQSDSGTGVLGEGGFRAGEFRGPVEVFGDLTVVNGNKPFKIDHPLDPQNKYLLHNAVEAPERKNVYDGVARLDDDGQAWVDLPKWFEALNGDVRYQLTAVGGSAPNLHVAEEVSENRFKIAGGQEGMKVCWQLTGTRKDPWAAANPFEVEQEKREEERGRYLEPSLHDAPEEQRVMRGPRPEAVEEEHRRQIDELRRLEEEQRQEIEEQLRRRREHEEEEPPEST